MSSILWEMVRPASSPRDLWYEAQVTVSVQQPASLVFEATVGETDRGDIALGNFDSNAFTFFAIFSITFLTLTMFRAFVFNIFCVIFQIVGPISYIFELIAKFTIFFLILHTLSQKRWII
jgi:hypothetical protein